MLVPSQNISFASTVCTHVTTSVCCLVLMLLPNLPSCTISLFSVGCGDPGTPSNGRRTGSSTTYNSVVTYTCNTGYTRQGSNRRTCQSNRQWSGSLPQCNRKFCFVLVVLYIISIYCLCFWIIRIYILYILTAPVRIVALAQQVIHLCHILC